MKTLVMALLLAPWLALAADEHDAKDIRKDIERHRVMAAAHEAAARCLEGGQKPEACIKTLQTACKGVGIGKYCGMKHEH